MSCASLRGHRKGWVYIVILVGAIAIVGSAIISGEVGLEEIAVSSLALFSTFLGATLAFRLNERREAEKTERRDRAALNRALFIVVRQHNAIAQLIRVFEPYTTPFDRAFNMPAFKTPLYADLSHNFVDLEFILESSSPDVLMELALVQETFFQAISALEVRNAFHLNDVQSKIDEEDLINKDFSLGQISSALGPRVYGSAMSSAENALKLVFACDASLGSVRLKLRKIAKELFPGQNFIDYQSHIN